MNDRHYANFHIAGFTYYNGVDVFESLKIGTPLSLKAEPENLHDPNAVAIYYKDEQIGYVPRVANELLRKFLNLNHSDLFEVKITQVTPDAHPEKQIRVVVRIKEKRK
jgi:hypothetical protein